MGPRLRIPGSIRFRLTAWYLREADREALGRIVGALEREAGARRLNGTGSLARLVYHHGEVDRLLSRAVDRQVAEHRKFRFLPPFQKHVDLESAASEEEDADSPSSGSPVS